MCEQTEAEAQASAAEAAAKLGAANAGTRYELPTGPVGGGGESVGIINDENAEARSLMNRNPCVCDGEATGVVCKNFWGIIQKFDAANADALRSGEKNRACTFLSGWPLEFVSEEKPTFCLMYEPRKTPGLVAITRRALRTLLPWKPIGPGYMTYASVKDFNAYRPMTNEEIADLRKAMPDKPSMFQRGKRPDRLSMQDIVEGEQINILKSGEQMPGTLSPETSAKLDGIFDPKK